MKKLLCLFLSLFTTVGFAKSINLYEQPQANSKVISSINTDTGIIPIYTPKDNKNWIKVGDPTNGNVGWLNQEELKAVSGFVLIQNIMSTGKTSNSYQIIQYGTPTTMNAEQAQAMTKQAQENQQKIQKTMNQIVKDAANMFNQAMPMIMPVIIVPEKNSTKQK